jgi:PAS domain S-box-containing protein
MGISRDITERRRAEEKIREQASLLDVTRDAIIVRDLEDRITYWNKGAEYLYGWTAEEAIGQRCTQLLYKKEGLPQFTKARENTFEKGEWSGELQQRTKDGKDIIVQGRWTLVRDENGTPKSVLVINSDITEKKHLESQILRMQRLESLGTLAGGIAHDLNNVLQPILMSVQIFQRRFTDESSQHFLEMVEKSARRGADIIKQVLTFARGAEGERIVFQPKHLIREMEQIARETFPKSIEIITDIQQDLWLISGDATQLHQVLMNLCVNARDAMPKGGRLTLAAENLFIDETYARMHLEAKPGSYVVLTVSDTGTGIPADILDKIFDPFFTTKEVGKGTGLGLSTVHAIVKDHGGFVNVYSEVGRGTRFTVYLPSAEASATQQAEEIPTDLPEGHGEIILVVDDEASVREIAAKILETYGYQVLTAEDGIDAVAVYAQHKEKIAVVLIDMMMPIMDGRAAIHALRRMNLRVKIIAMSGLTENGKVVEHTDMNVQAFLSKPYTAERLLRTVESVLLTY